VNTATLDKRLKALEAKKEPRSVTTLADFVTWCARAQRGIKEEVKLSPAWEKTLSDTSDTLRDTNLAQRSRGKRIQPAPRS